MRRTALAKANLQVEGYQGFDAKAYWGLQALTRVMDGMSIGQEAEVKVKAKNGHFKAMEQARRKKKEQRRVKVDAEKNNQVEGKRESLRNTQDVDF
ncbi:hypothetical protein WAI453_008439 [Rhynchosporium graminicola]